MRRRKKVRLGIIIKYVKFKRFIKDCSFFKVIVCFCLVNCKYLCILISLRLGKW